MGSCDNRCTSGQEGTCVCSCGGQNHGTAKKVFDTIKDGGTANIKGSGLDLHLSEGDNGTVQVWNNGTKIQKYRSEAEFVKDLGKLIRAGRVDIDATDAYNRRQVDIKKQKEGASREDFDTGKRPVFELDGEKVRLSDVTVQVLHALSQEDDSPRTRQLKAMAIRAEETGKITPAYEKYLESAWNYGLVKDKPTRSPVDFGTESARKGESRKEVQDEAHARYGISGASDALSAYDDERSWIDRPMSPPVRSESKPARSRGLAEERVWNDVLYRLESTRSDKASADAEAHFARKENHFARVVKRGDTYGIYTAEKR